MIKLRVAFIDGTVIEEEFLNDELGDVQLMIDGTPEDLLVRVEIEDGKQRHIFTFKKEPIYGY